MIVNKIVGGALMLAGIACIGVAIYFTLLLISEFKNLKKTRPSLNTPNIAIRRTTIEK